MSLRADMAGGRREGYIRLNFVRVNKWSSKCQIHLEILKRGFFMLSR